MRLTIVGIKRIVGCHTQSTGFGGPRDFGLCVTDAYVHIPHESYHIVFERWDRNGRVDYRAVIDRDQLSITIMDRDGNILCPPETLERKDYADRMAMMGKIFKCSERLNKTI